MTNKTFLKKMKEKLLSERQTIMAKTVSKRDIDLIDTDGDETDEIQGKMLIDLEKQLSTRNSDKINRINSALDKIDLQTYGICEDCGDHIPEKRLLINPYFTTCIGCAEDRELEAKQGKFN